MSEAEIELTRPRAIVLADEFNAAEPNARVGAYVNGIRLPSMSISHGWSPLWWGEQPRVPDADSASSTKERAGDGLHFLRDSILAGMLTKAMPARSKTGP